MIRFHNKTNNSYTFFPSLNFPEYLFKGNQGFGLIFCLTALVYSTHKIIFWHSKLDFHGFIWISFLNSLQTDWTDGRKAFVLVALCFQGTGSSNFQNFRLKEHLTASYWNKLSSPYRWLGTNQNNPLSPKKWQMKLSHRPNLFGLLLFHFQ